VIFRFNYSPPPLVDILILSSILSLAPVKRLALSARVVPFEPRPQPQYTKPLPVQVEEGLVVAVTVEESAAPFPSAATVVGVERVVTTMTAPQAALEPQAVTSSSGDDVVMVLVDQGAPLPSPTRERDAVEPVAPETSAAGTAPSTRGAEDMSMSRYLTIPSIGVIDLDETELPSNDWEILEVVMNRVFTDPSLLDSIVLGPPAPRQDRDAGGSVSSAAPEATEGVCSQRRVSCDCAPTPDCGSNH
jgi:hypothetical protein